MKTRHLFKLLNETFPLKAMGESFTGSHSITCKDTDVELAVWTLGKVFVFGLTDGDLALLESEEGCNQLVNEIVNYLNQNHQSK